MILSQFARAYANFLSFPTRRSSDLPFEEGAVMLQIVKKDVNINFLRYSNAALVFSGLLLLAGVVSLFTQGLNLGLDFTGGALIELHYPEAPEMDDVRSAMEDAGFED